MKELANTGFSLLVKGYEGPMLLAGTEDSYYGTLGGAVAKEVHETSNEPPKNVEEHLRSGIILCGQEWTLASSPGLAKSVVLLLDILEIKQWRSLIDVPLRVAD